MPEKKKLLMIGCLGILLVSLLFFVFWQKKQRETISPVGLSQPLSKVTPKPEALVKYKDTAGFQFDYPESLVVKDVSGNDETVYSSLELSKAVSGEKMKIRIVDTPFASINAWFKSKEASGAGAKREIVLADMPGSQIQFADPPRLVTVVINEGVLYWLESPLDNDGLWNKVHNDIVSSFTIAEDNSGEEIINEGEEVIE